jgi:two-component system sensor histidine kinase and response regulator WspE
MSRKENIGDYSMLDLFRQEVETQVTNLKQSLSILKRQPSLGSELETATRSLHAIAGSAQIIELEAAASLAAEMKAGLVASQEHSIDLTETQIDQLLHAGDLLVGMSNAGVEDLERWLAEHTEDFSSTQAAIALLASLRIDTPINSTDASGDSSRPAPVASPPTDPPLILGDSSMMELFRLEVEAQATILTNGLLALETQPQSAQELEALMRAAHSVKGAARIVGLDAAVQLAHVMEDCFVAAQNQTITLLADQIDVLLRGVDLLQSLSVSDTNLPHWLAQNDAEIELIRSTIAAMPAAPNSVSQVNSALVPQSSPLRLAVSPSPEMEAPVVQIHEPAVGHHRALALADAPSEPTVTAQDRVVRVSAENLNRMMGLAGESMIEANWLQPFADSLMLLKSRQVELSKSLEKLQQDALVSRSLDRDGIALLETARRKEQECRDVLSARLTELEGFVRRTANLSDRLYREVITSHMRPFADGVQGFPRMIRDIARQLNKQVKLDIVGKSTAVDRDILKKLEAPLTHILRNAVDHGLELPEERLAVGKPAEGTIRLEAVHRGGMLAIAIADDGKGIAPEILRQQVIDKNLATPEVAAKMTDTELMEFLFLPGFSMAKQVSELSGRGVGLDIAKSMAQEVGGTVRAISQPGLGTSFHFQLPLTLSVVRTLLVEISGEPYAFPLARIDQIVNVPKSEIAVVENRQYFTMDQKNIGLIPAHQVLDLPPPASTSDTVWVVIISDQSNTYGLVVDRCLGERELVVRPLDSRLGKVQDISAAALMCDGSLVLIVDVSDLVRSVKNFLNSGRLAKVGASEAIVPGSFAPRRDRKRVLVVDDSTTVREVERKLLQNRGYTVEVAVDGMDGWNAIRSQPYDLVISDIDMPRMNGIELIKQIKNHPRLKSVPVIVVSYRDREPDRIQGLEAGADYYLTKSSFHDNTLIEAVVDLIGE